MDAQKLLRIIRDLLKEEEVVAIGQKMDEIQKNIAQNSEAGFNQANVNREALTQLIREKTVSVTFSRTEALLIEQVGGISFVGDGLILKVDEIFSSRGYELGIKLELFRKERVAFFQKIKKLADNFADVGVQEYRPSEYEIGVIIPSELSSFKKTQDYLHDLEILLSALNETDGGEAKEIKITRAGNGSLEFFTLQNLQIVAALTTLFLNIGKIWDKITEFKKKIKETKEDKSLDENERDEIAKVYERAAQKIKKEILEELVEKTVKDSKIKDKERKHEVRNKVSIGIKAVFAWFEAGVQIDITPVRLEGAAATSEDATAQSAIDVQKTNLKLQEIAKLPKEIKALPFVLEDAGADTDGKERKG